MGGVGFFCFQNKTKNVYGVMNIHCNEQKTCFLLFFKGRGVVSLPNAVDVSFDLYGSFSTKPCV